MDSALEVRTQRPDAAGAPVIRTVVGDIDPAVVRIALFHEHLHTDMTPWKPDADLRFREVALVEADLNEARAAGVDLVVDATTADVGRDAQVLTALSRATGMHVVAATGLYRELTYPSWLDGVTDDDLAAMFVGEINDQIRGSGVRAGVFGEIGVSEDAITSREVKVVRAVAAAHQLSGAPIITHTPEGRHALALLDLLVHAGVDPAHIVIGHVDCLSSSAVPFEILKRGAYVGFDRIGLSQYASDEARSRVVMELLLAGYADRVLLSSDLARLSRLQLRGGRGYAGTITHFIPRLRALGLDPLSERKLVSENPRRFLAFAPVA